MIPYNSVSKYYITGSSKELMFDFYGFNSYPHIRHTLPTYNTYCVMPYVLCLRLNKQRNFHFIFIISQNEDITVFNKIILLTFTVGKIHTEYTLCQKSVRYAFFIVSFFLFNIKMISLSYKGKIIFFEDYQINVADKMSVGVQKKK